MSRTQKWTLAKAIDLPMAVAALLTVAFYAVVNHQFEPGSLIHRYTTEHMVEYVVVAFFIWGLVDVVFRVCGFPLELLALRQPGLPPRNGKEPVAHARALYASLQTRPQWFRDSRLGQRLSKALGYLQDKESADGFNDYLHHLAQEDDDQTYTNYGLIRFICWVAPVLGIFGTVIHFASAFAGMSPDQASDNLAAIMGEIGTAFSTTTAALITAITMMFSLFLCERTERRIVHRINRRVDWELVNRFEVVDESLTPFLHAVQSTGRSTLQVMDENLQRQLQIWSTAHQRLQQQSEQRLQSHAQLWEQSLAKVHERFEHSDSQREQKLLKLLDELQHQRGEQKTQSQSLANQMSGLHTHFGQLVETLKGLLQGEGELVKLQQSLAQNLQALRDTQQLDQAMHGLTAAIHLLTARHDPDAKSRPSRAA